MLDTDLCFERSDIEATITTPGVSIKNLLSGHIYAPGGWGATLLCMSMKDPVRKRMARKSLILRT